MGRRIPTDLSPTLTEQYSPCVILPRVGVKHNGSTIPSTQRAEMAWNAKAFASRYQTRHHGTDGASSGLLCQVRLIIGRGTEGARWIADKKKTDHNTKVVRNVLHETTRMRPFASVNTCTAPLPEVARVQSTSQSRRQTAVLQTCSLSTLHVHVSVGQDR